MTRANNNLLYNPNDLCIPILLIVLCWDTQKTFPHATAHTYLKTF